MSMNLPAIIQGGMGVAVSSWPLARAVSSRGQLGVVSGTGIDTVVARRLQMGDPGGLLRKAFDAFPVRAAAQRVWNRYFIEGGKRRTTPFRSRPLPTLRMPAELLDLLVVANFAEVHLARAGHDGLVGINLLEKVQLPNLASLFGAMLAGVGVVLMGAGIPRAIPGVLDRFAAGQPAELRLDVAGALPGDPFVTQFDPRDYMPAGVTELERPLFLPIVSSATLALTLARKSSGRVDGFVVEGPTAGGHNAPPRGALILDANGEPVYGPRDEPDFERFRELGLPFWLAGSCGRPTMLRKAHSLGAHGIQVGTAFAFCDESGIAPELKAAVIHASREHRARVFTDPLASPTGFPFKVAQIEGTLARAEIFDARPRVCDLGYLRQSYRRPDGSLGYRCPGERVETYLSKGGDSADTIGRKCVCNGLLATIGLGQVRGGGTSEPPLITAGDDVAEIAAFLKPGRDRYSAADVLDRLLAAGDV
jgi:NAD(P)H-dependent flavin oxidoreductase YrpB (nitropropane dioxygenase family)